MSEENNTHSDEMPGDVKQTWTDVSKSKKLLGYRPDFNLKKGLSNVANWFDKKEEKKAAV